MLKLDSKRIQFNTNLKKENKKLLAKMAREEQGMISRQLDKIIEEYAKQHGYKTD